MIIQAISLLDDLDKELNNYTMRLREWFGWHFPEMGKIVTDNIAFAKVRDCVRAPLSEFSSRIVGSLSLNWPNSYQLT